MMVSQLQRVRKNCTFASMSASNQTKTATKRDVGSSKCEHFGVRVRSDCSVQARDERHDPSFVASRDGAPQAQECDYPQKGHHGCDAILAAGCRFYRQPSQRDRTPNLWPRPKRNGLGHLPHARNDQGNGRIIKFGCGRDYKCVQETARIRLLIKARQHVCRYDSIT